MFVVFVLVLLWHKIEIHSSSGSAVGRVLIHREVLGSRSSESNSNLTVLYYASSLNHTVGPDLSRQMDGAP